MKYNYYIRYLKGSCKCPLRLDLYSGCSFNCIYCRYNKNPINYRTVANIKEIKEFLKNGIKYGGKSLEKQSIARNELLHIGGVSDPLQDREKIYRNTYQLLKFLNEFDYPVMLSTKSSLLLSPEYNKLIASMKSFILQVSMSSTNKNEKLLTKASLNGRLKVIKTYFDIGIPVILRWQPIILSKKFYIDFTLIIDYIDHVVCEFLNLTNTRNKEYIIRKMKSIGVDVQKYSHGYNIRFVRDILFKIKRETKIISNGKVTWTTSMDYCSDLNDIDNCCGVKNEYLYD